MTTQEAQTIINNWKGSKDDPKYKEAKTFLENQQAVGETKKSFKEKAKDIKDKLVMTPEEMQKMTSERADVQNAARRSQIANPSIGVVDRVMGNVTGRNEDLFDPWATKAKDLNADGSMADKNFQLGNSESSGNFIGAAKNENNTSNNGGTVNSSSGLDYRTEQLMNKDKAIANKAKKDELDSINVDAIKNWEDMYKTSDKVVNAYKNIEDKYIQQLPTFIFRRYQNGEFGDISDTSTPEGRENKKNAQLRMAHFMINGLGTMLSNVSNVIKGKELEQSDYEKYQNSNLEQGLANKWMKNNAETEEVIKLANKEADNEQDARFYVEQLTRDNALKAAWNKMDQNQKLYSINVSREIGKLIGDMNLEELSNFITARAMDGSLSEEQAVVAGLAVAVSHTPELLDKIPDDNVYKKALMKLFGNK